MLQAVCPRQRCHTSSLSMENIKLEDLTVGGKGQTEIKWNNMLNPLHFYDSEGCF